MSGDPTGGGGAEQPLPPAGLCNACRHQQLVRTTRGSVFSLCQRSRDEPERYPRYPRIPVIQCPGFVRDDASAAPKGASP